MFCVHEQPPRYGDAARRSRVRRKPCDADVTKAQGEGSIRHTGESSTEVWTSTAGFGFATLTQSPQANDRRVTPGAGLLKILRRNLIKEFTELLDLLLLGLLAGKLDSRLIEHLLGPVDRNLGSQCERDGVGGPRAHLDA